MKGFLPVTLAIALVALTSGAHAGQIWTDGNGDGLPDDAFVLAFASTNVTVGVWIDAQSFSWTNFLAYVEWSGDCISYVSASYVISGGSNFPIDNFSHPRAIGFGGSGYTQGGIDHIGNITLHINTPVTCCVTPIIDVYNPFYVFSQLGAGSAYMLFTTNPGSCYGLEVDPIGACCLPDLSCIAGTKQGECLAVGGTWFEGQDCSVCPQSTGACCFLDPCGTPCLIMTSDACAAAGGFYAGDGTPCTSCVIEQSGACCFPDGSCQVIIGDGGNCPGVYQGCGTDCTPDPCAQPTEACCFADGTCADLISADCTAQSGIPQGAGTSCAQVNCPQPPVGACCLPGFCVITTESDCAAQGGVYRGDGTNCDPPGCEPNAVESTSWGKVKGLFR